VTFLFLLILFNFVVPILLLFWFWRTRPSSRAKFVSIVVLFGAALTVLVWSVPWDAAGVFWPRVYLVAFGAILLARIIRGPRPVVWLPVRRREWIWTGLNIIFAAFWSWGVLGVVCARTIPAAPAPFELYSPFRHGSYYVVAGGANFSTNQHAFSRVSRYAIDITKLNDWGFAASGLFSSDLRSYVAFGADIVAPCSGEVIGTENALADQPPFNPDSSKQGTGGDHVVLFCQGHSVLIGHMRQGTVAVVVGDQVAAGQLLGQVGNSGNSISPHIHIGAVRGLYAYDRSDREAPPGIEPVPLFIQGRFLVRGDTLTASD